jgi:iron(III) transport system substrate-binding protein
VVVYTALDSEFSEPILQQFTKETGITALPKFDVESTKTVGLANAIIAEKARPRADVFWNNEILNTLRLRDQGLLDTYMSPVGQQYPATFRSADGRWYGFAARARVLIVNKRLVPESERPASIHDLADPKWRGKIGIAKPLFGTTATHAACLFAVLGEEKAKEYFRALKANDVQILSGNKQVALSVASGQLAFGLTDTDDAIIEKEKGEAVEIVYPDRQEDQLGTLFIPNTLSIIKGCPHPERARKLVDYLLQPAVEAKLAAGASAQIPLNPNTQAAARVQTPQTIKAMQVDFDAAAKVWDRTAEFIRDEFTTGT